MRSACRSLGALLLVLAFLLPTAKAETVTGSLTIRNATFPASTETTMEPAAALVPDTARIDGLTLTASRLRVTFYEKEYITAPVSGVPSIQTSLVPRSFTITTAALEAVADSDHAGHVGLYPRPTANLKIVGAATATAATASAIESGGPFTTDTPETWWYSQRVEGAHVLYTAEGGLSFSGPGSFKLYGPDVTIQGAENNTAETFRTGQFQTDALHINQAWLVLEAEDAAFTVAGSVPVEAAAKAPARLAWDGAAIVAGATGALTADGAIYSATDETATLDGMFSAILTPTAADSATIQASGDLRGTNLAAVPVPVSPLQQGAGPWLGIGAVLVFAGACALGLVLLRRRSPDEEAITLKRHTEIAHEHDMMSEWEDALSHVRAARKLKPTDGTLAHWEATLLNNQGDTEAALAAYEEASVLLPDGAAAFEAAVYAARAGLLDQARSFAARAVAQNADYRAELADDLGRADDPFAALRSDPLFSGLISGGPDE